MWTVVYMTQDEETASRVVNVLKQNNLIYKMRSVGETENNDNVCYEVLVPETEINEAHKIIIDNNLM